MRICSVALTCYQVLTIALILTLCILHSHAGFSDSPTLTLTGPIKEMSTYTTVGMSLSALEPINGDVFTVNFGSLTEQDITNHYYTTISSSISPPFPTANCFWIQFSFSGEVLWAHENVYDPEAIDHTPMNLNVLGRFVLPSTLPDFASTSLALRCHVFLHTNGDYFSTNFVIDTQFHDTSLSQFQPTISPNGDDTPPPRQFPLYDYGDYISSSLEMITEPTPNSEYNINDGSLTLYFNIQFPTGRPPNRGDEITIHIGSMEGMFDYVQAKEFTCTFSQHYLQSTTSIQSYRRWVPHSGSFQARIHPVYTPSAAPTTEYVGSASCSIKFTKPSQQAQQVDSIDLTSINELKIETTFACDFRGLFLGNTCVGQSASQLTRGKYGQPSILWQIPPTPTFIQGNQLRNGGSKTLTIPTYKRCGFGEHFRDVYCIPNPPSTGTVAIVYMLLEIAIEAVAVGTTTLNWDNNNTSHTIQFYDNISFPTGAAMHYYITSTGYMDLLLFADAKATGQNIIFLSDCLEIFINEDQSTFPISTCSNGECEQYRSGLCTCPSPNENFFNPVLQSPNFPMCTAIEVCDITCQGGATSIRDELTNLCTCQCELTTPWRDCRLDRTPITYKPIITVQQASIPRRDQVEVPHPLTGSVQDALLTISFGTLDEFYTNNLHYVNYFQIEIANPPQTATNIFDLLDYTQAQLPIPGLTVAAVACTWVVKEQYIWHNITRPLPYDTTIKSTLMVPNSFFLYSQLDYPIQESFSEFTIGLYKNPRYKTTKPTSRTHLTQEILLVCDFPVKPDVDYASFRFNVKKFGAEYISLDRDIDLPLQVIHEFPTRRFQLSSTTPTDVSYSLDSHQLAVRLQFNLPLNAAPMIYDSIGIRTTTSTKDKPYELGSYQCRFRQTGTNEIVKTFFAGFHQIIWGEPNPRFTADGGIMSCMYTITGSGNVFTDSLALLHKLIHDEFGIVMDKVNGISLLSLITIKFDTTIPLATVSRKYTFVMGEEVFFDYDQIAYPQLIDTNQFNTSSITEIKMYYPTSATIYNDINPITIGFATLRHGKIITTISQPFLRSWIDDGLSFELQLINYDRSVTKIPLTLISHINPVIVPYCLRETVPNNLFGFEIYTNTCPNDAQCVYGNTVETIPAQDSCLCSDSTTNCLCQDKPNTIWNGYSCVLSAASNNNENDCTSLTCKNDSIGNDSCTACICPENTFWEGDDCNNCNLQCLNGGTQSLLCKQCNCPRRGYSGLYCQCHDISFTLVLSSVPKFILDEYEKSPNDIGSSFTALNYIRSQLLLQQTQQDFDTLGITKLELNTASTQLTINGYVRDNCNTDLKANNYNELQQKWTDFLNLLKKIGIKIDDEIIKVESVSIEYPELKCDELFDQDCDGKLKFDPNNAIIHFTIIQILFISMIMLITLF